MNPSLADASAREADAARAASLALAQGAYYAATGIWAILHQASFQAVTGPEREDWLVRTVGALVGVTGAALIRAAMRGVVSRDLAWVAAGQAVALAAVDVVYATRGQISPIYLADAAVEVGLVAAWASFLGPPTADDDPAPPIPAGGEDVS